MDLLDCLEHTPGGAVRGSVIWLHGLGANGYDFAPLVPHLGLAGVRFVFPHAAAAPVTINGGMSMPSWYDIRSLDHASKDREDPAGVRASAKQVRGLIARERERGVPPERIVLIGFSQGGAMAMHVGLRAERALLGVVVLSAYAVVEATIEAEVTPAAKQAPWMFGHGRQDDVVPVAGGRAAYEMVRRLGIEAAWHDYPMAHSVNDQEVRDIRAFLHARFRSLP